MSMIDDPKTRKMTCSALILLIVLVSFSMISLAHVIHVGSAGLSLEQTTIFVSKPSAELERFLRELRWTLLAESDTKDSLSRQRITTRNSFALITRADVNLTAACDVADALFRPILTSDLRFSRANRPLYASEIVIGAFFRTRLRQLAVEHVAESVLPLSEKGVVWFDDLSILFNVDSTNSQLDATTIFDDVSGRHAHALSLCDVASCERWLRSGGKFSSLFATHNRPRVHVVMLFDSTQRRWGTHVEQINRQRALAAGWTFDAAYASLDTSRATAWGKVLMLQRAIDLALSDDAPVDAPEWVLWLDADAVLQHDVGAPRIESLLAAAARAGRDVVMSVDPPVWECKNLCTGVMAWRASRWSSDFFKLWWQDAETRWGGTFVHAFSWEQRILNALWPSHVDHFYVVPHCALNAPCNTSLTHSHAMVVHCMGAEAPTRLARVELELAGEPASTSLLLVDVPLSALPHSRVDEKRIATLEARTWAGALVELQAHGVIAAAADDAALIAVALERVRSDRWTLLDVRAPGDADSMRCKAFVAAARRAGMRYEHLLKPTGQF
jgi:hypothetical protein